MSDPLSTRPHLLTNAGNTGGICDGAFDDDATEAAGWPFFGQLIAHDITADRSPITGADTLRNARRPRLDLEMLYGDGPIGSPFLYDVTAPGKFLLSADGADVPRNSQGVALIGDPRNDSHLFALSLHVALLRAHNRIVDLVGADRARTTLTWHYQWIVVHDFLPRLVGAPLVGQVLADGRTWDTVPLEFAHAAFRYGHGQIRDSYRLVPGGPLVPLLPDLVGFRPLPADLRLDLTQIFDVPGRPPAQRAKRLDGRLPRGLIALPEPLTGPVASPSHRSLAVRDLLRGETTGLPSGETVAHAIGVEPLTADELEKSWPDGTPLWFYILKEAEHRGGGDRLGPVGGRIVAEVLVGLLLADPSSYLSREPSWEPTLPAAGSAYGLVDLLMLGAPGRTSSTTANATSQTLHST
ncbi:peroxidase [Actinoplanes sp. NBC_00393]|uniref:peroxidase family protein n=1 Tax=Actinoplanes sp. NBC_00393 TaxID=2975953 RepID=UPI002E1B225A